MDIRTSAFVPLCLLVTLGTIQAMDQVPQDIPEFMRDPRPGHTNVFAIQRLGGTNIEHQYVRMGSQQEYDPSQPWLAQMRDTLNSGFKETVFDIGHCPGKFLDYGLHAAATLCISSLIGFMQDKIARLFYKNDLEKQESRRMLAQLATEDALIQSLAVQLKGLPRATDTERETFRKLHEQYVSILALHSAHTASYMTLHSNKITVPAAA
jgi:hypothetical protein